jgi:hypothetical membrane protein
MAASELAAGRALAAAGLFWFLAGFIFLVTEAVAAAGFPGYSYARDFISDLGVPYRETIGGRPILSSRAAVMNGGFAAEALSFVAALASVTRAHLRWTPALAALLPVGLVHAIGLVLIAAVHSGSRELAAGTYRWHEFGAGMAIVGGNVAILAAARVLRELGAPRSYGRASVALALLGLLSLGLLLWGGLRPAVPDGVTERGSVYAIAAWEMLSGLVLLLWVSRTGAGTPFRLRPKRPRC